MASIIKTAGTQIFGSGGFPSTVASGAVGLGASTNVLTQLAATIYIRIGRTVATALSNGVKVRVEGSAKATLDGFWFPLAEFLTAVTASTTTATLTTGTTAGTATLPMTTTTAILIGDKVYIREAGAETNSEFGRVITVNASTSIVLEDGTLYNHTITTTKVWSKAEFFTCQLDLSAVSRIRVVIDCAYALSGQTIVADAWMVTGDSIG